LHSLVIKGTPGALKTLLGKMVIVAQLVRAPDCDSGGRGFEPRPSPFCKPCGKRTESLIVFQFVGLHVLKYP
jgi:hypothetical protein